MAIVVLVLWLFTAGAGFYLLVTSSLGRGRPVAPEPAAAGPRPASASAAQPAPASTGLPPAAARSISVPMATSGTQATSDVQAPAEQRASAAAGAGPAASVTTSRREMRRAVRDRWDPPSLTAAKKAPVMPGARSLLEFAHPVCGLIGLAFWLGFTMVHNRALGWIAFGLVAVTACLGLAWLTANVRAAGHGDGDRPAPYFVGRLIVLHGSAAVITVTLAALTALVIRG